MSAVGFSAGSFERRFVALMAADVANYCLHMSSNDDLTLSRLLTCRQIMETLIAATGGRMFGVAGDSWMAEFYTPLDAVCCAAEFQKEVARLNRDLPLGKRIKFRIGIHIGDGLVHSTGLFGDDVNIAARLGQICTPGHLILSEAVYKLVRDRIDLDCGPLGPQRLKNIPKMVSAFCISLDNEGYCRHADTASPHAPNRPVRSALAVLPFSFSGGETGEIHYGEALADDLTAGLSKLRWLPVIASQSVLALAHRDMTLDEIGTTLGVRYLVSGTIKRKDEAFALSVNLNDTQSGCSQWNRLYEIGDADDASIRSDVLLEIVASLNSEIERVEYNRLRAHSFEQLDAWELIRCGVWHAKRISRRSHAAAWNYCQAAAIRDPDSSEVNVQLALWHFLDYWLHRKSRSGLGLAETYAMRALALDHKDFRVHKVLGLLKTVSERPALARTHFRQALNLNPSSALCYGFTGASYIVDGSPARAIEPLFTALRLSPCEPMSFHFLASLAAAYYMQRDFAKSEYYAERSLILRPNFWYATALRIAATARRGDIERAKALSKNSVAEISQASIDWLPFTSRKWKDYLSEGLQMAGCEIENTPHVQRGGMTEGREHTIAL